jgi:hypothetical protein
MQLAHYLGLQHKAERDLAAALRTVAHGHAAEPDVHHTCLLLAGWSDEHSERLSPFIDRYGEDAPPEPDRLYHELFGQGTRSGGLGLLRDLHDLYLMSCECDITWVMLGQAARAIRDVDLLAAVTGCERQTATQRAWLTTRMKQAAPQALVVVP